MSDERCEGMARFLRRLAPGTPVAVWFDNSGFLTTYFQFLQDDVAAFSGGALGSGTTYVYVCAIQALNLAGAVAATAGMQAAPQGEVPGEPEDKSGGPSNAPESASAPSNGV